MRLLPEAAAILESIESLSGRPVRFMEDRDLPVLSAMQVTRDGAAFRVLRYRPSDDPLYYRVAYQAAFTLRLFQCPAGERFDLAALPEARAAARELVAAGMPLTDEETAAFSPFSAAFADCALMQLRSIPVGMRIDRWIRDTMPVLRSQQEAAVAEIQQSNLDATSKPVGRLGVPDGVPPVPTTQDRELIDRWAGAGNLGEPRPGRELGLAATWYPDTDRADSLSARDGRDRSLLQPVRCGVLQLHRRRGHDADPSALSRRAPATRAHPGCRMRLRS